MAQQFLAEKGIHGFAEVDGLPVVHVNMGTVVEEEMFSDVGWQGSEHIINMEWFNIPVLRAVGEDDFGLDLICMEQVVAVVPKLIVISSLSV